MKRLSIVLISCSFLMSAWSQEIGLQLYSLRNQFQADAPHTCEMVADMGIDIVEEGLQYGHSVEELNAMFEANDLQLVSASASFEQLRDDPGSVAERAKALGVRFVVCFWIPHNGDDFTIDNVTEALRVFDAAGKLLKKHDLRLCYHPHGYEFRPFENTTLIDYMISRSRHFDFEIDVFWVKHSGTEPLALMRKYPDRFPLMHAKDRRHGTIGNVNGRADVESNVVLGTGDVGMRDLILEARKIGMDYIFIEDESSRSEKQIPQSLEFIKSVLKE